MIRHRHRILAVIILIALGVAAPIVWHKQIRYRYSPKNFGEAVPGVLYRGADQHINVLRDICEDHKIRTVIDLSGADAEEDSLCRELKIDRYAFDLPGDGRGDPAKWAAVLNIIADPNHQPVFVHCSAGAQRTTTAVLLYRHFIEGQSFQSAYPESFDFRHKPKEWVLMAYLADHAERIRQMRESGVAEQDGQTVSLDELVSKAQTTAKP